MSRCSHKVDVDGVGAWGRLRPLWSEAVVLELFAAFQGRPLHEVLREGGVAGAGGAGFPTWAKYVTPQPFLVVNAQESEPGYFIDKWLHEQKAAELLDLLAWLRTWGVGKTIVAAKLKDRPSFETMERLASEQPGGMKMLDCTGRNRHKLADQPEPVLFTYTDDKYPFGMETALLLIIAQQKIPQGERPTQHGFIINNTETLFNVHQLLTTGAPVTTKHAHVYGFGVQHTFRAVPIGTPAATMLQDAGLSVEELQQRGFVVVDGGPGWFEKIDPLTAVISRRTNSLLVLDPSVVDVTQKDVFEKPNKPGVPSAGTVFAKAPTTLDVSLVRVPLVDNPAFKAVRPALPIVKSGDKVTRGQPIARASNEGVSLWCHASIDGVVGEVTAASIEIRRSDR
ncbi:MAG: NADH dehydrogenase subunit [Deltaproteobacteria bacterium]|nr:NADH dehydrogenase subunit [Deltaproteobacteria bacterium]